MIDTAHAHGVKIAAHASLISFRNLLGLGVDSIEHGGGLQGRTLTDAELYERMREFAGRPEIKWVPTLSVFYKIAEFGGWNNPYRNSVWEETKRMFKIAVDIGMENIACGGDTGAFSHGDNALEMKLMVRLGAEWKQVLRWATLGGWECIRPMGWRELDRESGLGIPLGDNDVKFGRIEKGWAADLVALEGDIENDFEATLDRVQFVMKRGKIYKMGGQEVV
jgi:imidazolonepropionase-like amidohydrolase